jgi:hypothetical protein
MLPILIRNVILYDRFGNVVGFVEFKKIDGVTHIRAKHNLIVNPKLTINGKVFKMQDQGSIDLSGEILIDLEGLASGELNSQAIRSASGESAEPPGALKSILADTSQGIIRPLEPKKEIDQVLRAVCSIDDRGKGICEGCPYREHFYGESAIVNA